jgi:hypothetical protein
MVNPPRKKGTAAESALVAWLRGHGHPDARRNAPNGSRDVGDIGGIETPCTTSPCFIAHDVVVVEVKSVRDLARGINEGLAELEVEKYNAGTGHGVLVVKRVGKGDPGEWLAIRRVADDPELGARR